MKIDIEEEQNQEINHERGSLIDIETDDGHQSQENELYHASIVSLSSSSVEYSHSKILTQSI